MSELYCFPLRGDESVYIVVRGDGMTEARITACGLEIGEWDRNCAKIPPSVYDMIRKHVPGAKVLDFFAGEPLHLGVSPFASFHLYIRATSTPSVTLFPADNSPTGPLNVTTPHGVIRYEKDWCGYVAAAPLDNQST